MSTISIKATDDLGNVAYIRQRQSGTWYFVLANGTPCGASYAGIKHDQETAIHIVLEACRTADEALAVVRRHAYKNAAFSIVDGPRATSTPKRIIIDVTDGVAEIVDSEGWPDGLELFIVDCDCGDMDASRLHMVEGQMVEIRKFEAGDRANDTGHYAKTVAEEWANG